MSRANRTRNRNRPGYRKTKVGWIEREIAGTISGDEDCDAGRLVRELRAKYGMERAEESKQLLGKADPIKMLEDAAKRRGKNGEEKTGGF